MKRCFKGIGVALIVLSLFAATAWAELPRSASLATHGVGSLFNALGTGIATVISRNTPMTIRVQPFAGPPSWLPTMGTGETEMGILTGADAVASYRGIVLYKKRYKNTRLLLVGGPLQLGFYVAKKSSIKTLADLKGKKIPTDYPGMPIVMLSSTAALASVGLSYKDIVKVPVSDFVAGGRAFLEGRTDAGWLSMRAPITKEANARISGGIRLLSVDASPEGAKRMADVYPGSYPSVIKKGKVIGAFSDVAVLTNDTYLVVSKDFSDEAAYAVVKSLWDNYKELGAAYGALRSWRPGRMVKLGAVLPYHPGAIKFFKEKGKWGKEMDAQQAKRLAE